MKKYFAGLMIGSLIMVSLCACSGSTDANQNRSSAGSEDSKVSAVSGEESDTSVTSGADSEVSVVSLEESSLSDTSGEDSQGSSPHIDGTFVNGYWQVSQTEAMRLMEEERDYLIVDVRRNDEFETGHIPEAICIPNESIEKTPPAQLPQKDQLILIYCRSGNRSKDASAKLAQMGYTRIVEFGGIKTWTGEIVT